MLTCEQLPGQSYVGSLEIVGISFSFQNVLLNAWPC
jgi:hypothetical protein